MALQVGILEAWRSSGYEGIGDAQDDESSTFAGVEDAGAVGEAACLRAQLAHLIVAEIENLDGLDRVRNFLAVGSYVLYRRAAHAAGNAAQALNARAVRGHAARHKSIPRFTGADFKENFAIDSVA